MPRWFRPRRDRTAWRLRLAAWVAVVAILMQTLTLFAPAQASADRALAALADLPGISASAVVLCLDVTSPKSDGSTPGHVHGVDCPLCQAFGHALACEPGPSVGVLIASGDAWILNPFDQPFTTPRAPDLAGAPRGPPLKA